MLKSVLIVISTFLMCIATAIAITNITSKTYPIKVMNGNKTSEGWTYPIVFILIDTETGREYIVVKSSYGVSVTPRLSKN